MLGRCGAKLLTVVQLTKLIRRFAWPPSVWACEQILLAHESQQRWDSRVSVSDNPDGR